MCDNCKLKIICTFAPVNELNALLKDNHLTIIQGAIKHYITMAKIQGLVGGMSGKMGNAVFRQRAGQTIVSQYQPVVANPNTEAQQVARAKFKLITQLAAIMAPALAIVNRPARQGRNPRTGFVAKNYGLIVADPSPEAAERVTIPMEQLQLTDSVEFFGTISANHAEGNTLVVTIQTPPRAGRKKGKIALVGFGTMGTVDRPARARVIEVVDQPFSEGSHLLTHTFRDIDPSEEYTILAYGMYETSDGSTSLDYDNIHTPADDDFISVVNIERAVSEGAMLLTETIGVNVEAVE